MYLLFYVFEYFAWVYALRGQKMVLDIMELGLL